MIEQFFFFCKIILVMVAGIALGWWYCMRYIVKPLRAQNKSLRKVDIREISTHMGSVHARTSEWPMNAEEYLTHHSIERDGGVIEISYEAMENDLNVFAHHLLTRQKRDFMKICDNIKGGDKVKAKINP